MAALAWPRAANHELRASLKANGAASDEFQGSHEGCWLVAGRSGEDSASAMGKVSRFQSFKVSRLSLRPRTLKPWLPSESVDTRLACVYPESHGSTIYGRSESICPSSDRERTLPLRGRRYPGGSFLVGRARAHRRGNSHRRGRGGDFARAGRRAHDHTGIDAANG